MSTIVRYNSEINTDLRSAIVQTNDSDIFETFWFRLARRIIVLLCKLSFLDMNKVSVTRYQKDTKKNDGPIEEEPPWRPQRQPLWTHLVRIFFIYVSIKVAINLYLQHDYDYKRDLMIRYLSQRRIQVDLSLITVQIVEAQRRLKLIGAPYMRMNFVLEMAQTFFLVAVNLGYIVPQVYFHFRPIDYSLFRYLLDPKSEQIYLDKLIRDEVDKFLCSSDNFIRFPRSKSNQMKQTVSVDNHNNHITTNLTAHLKQLMLEGNLQPVTRRPEWLKQCAMILSVISLFVSFFGTNFILCCLIIFPAIGIIPTFKAELDPLDILMAVEIFLIGAVGVQSIVIYVSIMFVSSMDQIKLLSENTRQMINSIHVNEYEFNHFLKTTSYERWIKIHSEGGTIENSSTSALHDEIHQRIDQISNLMNRGLLNCLMRYKIFIAQLEQVQRSSGFLITMVLILMSAPPIIGRFYASYVNWTTRFLLALCSTGLVLFFDLYFVSLCYKHKRCLKLYSTLMRFLVHTVQVASVQQSLGANQLPMYDKYLVSLLFKELRHPEGISARFATKALGISVTYANFAQINFYLFLINLSMVSVESNWRIV